MSNVDLVLCEICLEEFPRDEIRVCLSCGSDRCGSCTCEICHGAKEKPVYCSTLDDLAERDDFDPDEPLEIDDQPIDDQAKERWGGDRGEFIPSSEWVRKETAAIRAEWSSQERRRRRRIGMTESEATEARHWEAAMVHIPADVFG